MNHQMNMQRWRSQVDCTGQSHSHSLVGLAGCIHAFSLAANQPKFANILALLKRTGKESERHCALGQISLLPFSTSRNHFTPQKPVACIDRLMMFLRWNILHADNVVVQEQYMGMHSQSQSPSMCNLLSGCDQSS